MSDLDERRSRSIKGSKDTSRGSLSKHALGVGDPTSSSRSHSNSNVKNVNGIRSDIDVGSSSRITIPLGDSGTHPYASSSTGGPSVNSSTRSAAAPATACARSTAQGSVAQTDRMTIANLVGTFLPYLPQDDAVATGLGEWEGAIDASEAQEVADFLNQRLAALLQLNSCKFSWQVVRDESLHTFVDTYLCFRRRWYDGKPYARGAAAKAVIVGDGELSRRVFMLLYRLSSNDTPAPASESLSSTELADFLQEKRVLDLPKLLDVCAVYYHDNPDLTRRLVNNVLRAQPSYARDLDAMVGPLMQAINTMHHRCYSIIESQKGQLGHDVMGVKAMKKQLIEVVEYLDDVIMALNAFVGAYPPAASILVSAGVSESRVDSFLPSLASIHDSMLPTLCMGFAALGSPPSSSSRTWNSKEDIEVAAQLLVKRLKLRLIDFSWNLLRTCYLGEQALEDADFPPLRVQQGRDGGSKATEYPAMKGNLVQAALALALGSGESDGNGTLASVAPVNQMSTTGALLRSIDRRHGLRQIIHELCQSDAILLDDAQCERLLALIADNHPSKLQTSRRQAANVSDLPKPSIPDQKDEAVFLQSKISQVKDLFPGYGDGFVAACLEAYDNDPEKVIQQILDGKLHPDLASLDVTLSNKPSYTANNSRDKGKGKLVEEPSVYEKGRILKSEERDITARVLPLSSTGTTAGVADVGLSSKGPPPDSPLVSQEGMKGQPASLNHGRFMRRDKVDDNFNELLTRRAKDEAFSATVRAGKQYDYEDEYDDSFDDLAGTYLTNFGEEETENLADLSKRRSMHSDISQEDSDWATNSRRRPSGRGTLHQVVPGDISNQSSNRRTNNGQGPSKGILSLPNQLGMGRNGSGNSDRGSNSGTLERGKLGESRTYAVVAPSSSRLASLSQRPAGLTTSTKPVGQIESPSAPSGPTDDQSFSTASNGTSRTQQKRGKGKIESTTKFYLKDGKLYNYKVVGAEAGFASVEEFEASKREEEAILFGLGSGGNVPAAMAEARDSGNFDGGTSMAAAGRGPPNIGHHLKKDNNKHRRKEQAMKKHFGGLAGL